MFSVRFKLLERAVYLHTVWMSLGISRCRHHCKFGSLIKPDVFLLAIYQSLCIYSGSRRSAKPTASSALSIISHTNFPHSPPSGSLQGQRNRHKSNNKWMVGDRSYRDPSVTHSHSPFAKNEEIVMLFYPNVAKQPTC